MKKSFLVALAGLGFMSCLLCPVKTKAQEREFSSTRQEDIEEQSERKTLSGTLLEEYAPLRYDAFYYNLFDGITEEELDNPKKLFDRITWRGVFRAIDAYEPRQIDYRKYAGRSFLELYSEAIEEEVRDDPPSVFDVPEDYKIGDPIFVRQLVSPLLIVGRIKSRTIREGEYKIEQVKEYPSFRYRSERSGVSLRIGPTIDGLLGEDIRLRMKVGFSHGERIEVKAGLKDVKASFKFANMRWLKGTGPYIECRKDIEDGGYTLMLIIGVR